MYKENFIEEGKDLFKSTIISLRNDRSAKQTNKNLVKL